MSKAELYGIRNCDTMKKAFAWLDEHHIAYQFHDYKKEGADPARLAHWCEIAGWETLLNRRGTTFRKLSDADKADLDESSAIALMAAQPSMIKRPVIEYPGGLIVGFKPDDYAEALL
ncbi:ArsC family reductase [Stakelama marina]|uniref:ArsC family reductase n=1 Tax=Stakelama marina TaxID=2826939 RepID=A0A8T4IDM1_9SPHN|nr:ArsC family reductase [Stakelama marina]MBR0552182.1 ArsC family reductase [Stakelama marina]